MLKLTERLIVEDVDTLRGIATIVDRHGNRYELHIDECYAQRCSQAQAVCHRLIELAATCWPA